MAGILTTALTCATGVTATFAWFSLEPFRVGPVVQFAIAENAESTLQMWRLDDNDQRMDPESDDSGRAAATLDPVTSAGSTVIDGYPVLKTAPRMQYSGGDAKADSYLTLKYEFQCDRDCWITLAAGTKVVPNQRENAIKDNPEQLNEAVHALRVRFNGSDADGNPTDITGRPDAYDALDKRMDRGAKGEDVYFGGVADMMPYDGFYDNADGKEYCYGLDAQPSDPSYWYDGETSDTGKEGGNFLDAAHKSGVKLFDVQRAKKEHLIPKEEAPYFSQNLIPPEEFEGQLPSGLFLLDLKANQPKKLVVTVYIEGWDPYCTNDIGNASMTLDLVFTGLAH